MDLGKISSIMSRDVITLEPKEILMSAVEKMNFNNVSCVVIVEDKKPTGILTERDIIQIIGHNINLNVTRLVSVMKSPVIAISEEIDIPEAANLMVINGLRRLVVVDGEHNIIGIVTQTDIIKNLSIDSFMSFKKVEQIMKRKIISLGRKDTVSEAVELMIKNRISCVLVIEDDKPVGIITERDITKSIAEKNMLKEKSRALMESEIKYRTLVERSLEGIMIIQEGLIKFVNPTLLKILSYEEKEMLGRDILRFLYPDERQLLLENLNKLGNSDHVESALELRIMHKNGEGNYMEMLSTQIQYEGKPAVLATFRDITERKKTEAELKRLEITDDLAELFNQRYFYIQLVKEIERAKRHNRPLSMLLIDIDIFKDFNDRYGHWEGDYVLKKIGEILMKNVREIDMAFRFGGGEFAVLLPDTKHEDAIIVAERIRKSVAQTVFYPFTLNGQPDVVSKTVSIGVTEFRR